jgi:hypothetical protein
MTGMLVGCRSVRTLIAWDAATMGMLPALMRAEGWLLYLFGEFYFDQTLCYCVCKITSMAARCALEILF